MAVLDHFEDIHCCKLYNSFQSTFKINTRCKMHSLLRTCRHALPSLRTEGLARCVAT